MITIDFENRKELGLCEFLYTSIKKQIFEGYLKANEKLPSKRSLAEHLGVSIITVQNAYNQLISEGYLYSFEKKGFFVTDISIENPFLKKQDISQKNLQINTPIKPTVKESFFTDFTSNSTSVEKFPFNLWSHIMRKVLNTSDEKLLQKIDVKGTLELRSAIAKYLLEFRNMNVNPEQIIVGAGTETLYTMIVQLLGRKKIYAVENPGYHKIAKILELNGAKYIPVNIDSQGIDPKILKETNADIIHISPSHHFPTGIVMPVRRRLEILKWLADSSSHFIIEDDYDSEFRFNGKPLQPLQSYDKDGKVIYINTFSKTLSPSFRISYMVIPNRLLQLFEKKMGFHSCSVSAFEQYTLAEFIEKGFYGKHIIRMKNYYRNLRNTLISALESSSISKYIEIKEEEAGLHFLLYINTKKTKEELQNCLKSVGIKTVLLSDFYYQSNSNTIFESKNVFVINYSGIKKDRIAETIRRLESAI